MFEHPAVEYTVIALGVLQTLLCGFIAAGVFATNGPLAVDSRWNTRIRLLGKPDETVPEPEEGSLEMLLTRGPDMAGIFDGEAGFFAVAGYYTISCQYLLEDPVVLMHLSYFLMAVAGTAITPFILSYHLLDVVYGS